MPRIQVQVICLASATGEAGQSAGRQEKKGEETKKVLNSESAAPESSER